jgi:hypothetical protein
MLDIPQLDDLDAAAAATRRPAKLDPAALGPAWLPNGLYTLTLPCGTHRTLRVYTQQEGIFAGKRLLALLIGPDNTRDFEDTSFVFPSGIRVWKRFRGKKPDEYAALLWSLMSGEKIEGCSVQLSKRCIACNRELTTPGSLERGYGPTCAERLGVAT